MANSKLSFGRMVSAFFRLPDRGSHVEARAERQKIPFGWVLIGLVAFSAVAWYIIFKVIL